jgi:leader peptidase (prepilin peptidase) / N-methyltransferase
MFFLTFYLFSLLLSYTDCKNFNVPNNILIVMFFLLLIFGIIEEKIDISSFVVPILVLLVFIAILLSFPRTILGGGDIKYMMIVAFFLPYSLFPIFLIITGILQTIALILQQKLRKRRIVAMVPLMFASVVMTQILSYLEWIIM